MPAFWAESWLAGRFVEIRIKEEANDGSENPVPRDFHEKHCSP